MYVVLGHRARGKRTGEEREGKWKGKKRQGERVLYRPGECEIVSTNFEKMINDHNEDTQICKVKRPSCSILMGRLRKTGIAY